MSEHLKIRERRKEREQRRKADSQTNAQKVAGPRNPTQPRHQLPSTNASQTHNPIDPIQHSDTRPPPAQYGPVDDGRQVSTKTTTTTTTTTMATNQLGQQSNINTQPDVNYVANHLQNMQLQQGSQEQPVPNHPPQPLPPAATSSVGNRQNQTISYAYSSTGKGPVVQPKPKVPNQNPKYPVTVEQRTAAFSQWCSSHTSAPQRRLDRTKQEYMSGQRDKDIYGTLMQQQQAQKAQKDAKLHQAAQDLHRKQQKAKRDERMKARQVEREAAEQESRQAQLKKQLQQSAKEADLEAQRAISKQKRHERQRQRELREQQNLLEQQNQWQHHQISWPQQQNQWQQQLPWQQQQNQWQGQSQFTQQNQWQQHDPWSQQSQWQEQNQWQQQNQAQEQQFMPNPMGGFNGYGNYGGGMSTDAQTSTTTEIAQITTQLGVTSQSGESRKKAINEGASAVEQYENQVQTRLSQLGICPMGWQWVPDADASGYMCCGGNHFIPDHEIDKMLSSGFHFPEWIHCNTSMLKEIETMQYGAPLESYPLKKPPEQVPRYVPCWMAYERAKMFQENETSGMAGGPWNPGMMGGF